MTKHHAGEEIVVVVDRQGLCQDEGIAHLPDDTMVVVLGAGERVGQTVEAVVTGTLQTSLGVSLMASAKA
jgi:uncharacterized protein YacL